MSEPVDGLRSGTRRSTAEPSDNLLDDLPGLPRATVDPWLRHALPDLVGDAGWSAELISGGLSNITYRLQLSGGAVILRRPPLGGVLPSAHDMRREYRVISGLATTAVPVPEALALGEDPAVLGYPFFVMSDVRGDVLRTAQDTGRLSVTARSHLSAQFVQTLADLHAVDVEAVGLDGYGHGAGYAARQVRRWGEQWQRSRQRDLPDLDRLIELLANEVPPDGETTIVHGDYRLDNTVVELAAKDHSAMDHSAMHHSAMDHSAMDHSGEDAAALDRPRIAAVLDWELSTLGDPLADLALAMTYWHDRGDDERAAIPVAVGVTAHEGFPTAAELAEQYSRLTGRELAQLPFFLGLAAMKLAVILEGVMARHRAGHTVSGGYDRVSDAVPALVARGLRALQS